jgi:hypothetical protein
VHEFSDVKNAVTVFDHIINFARKYRQEWRTILLMGKNVVAVFDHTTHTENHLSFS